MSEVEETRDKIFFNINLINDTEPMIIQAALDYAANDEDEGHALEILEAVREKNLTNAPFENADTYIHNLASLKEIAEITEQSYIATDLSFAISMFSAHKDIVGEAMLVKRKELLHAALRDNWYNN